jgi:hypothetical protein
VDGVLRASVNAKRALECGYTSARCGGSPFNFDVWLKKAIDDDLVAGPRLAASTLEPGKLADAPAYISVLEDRSRILSVLQGGVIKAGPWIEPSRIAQ